MTFYLNVRYSVFHVLFINDVLYNFKCAVSPVVIGNLGILSEADLFNMLSIETYFFRLTKGFI